MKNKIFKTITLTCIFAGIWFIIKTNVDNNKETQYCGNVVNIYMTSAGYKASPTRHVVFYNDSLKRNIDVRVATQQYVNTAIGQRICFDLNKMQLEE